MIEHQVEQGSAQWHALRLGIPTASEFDRIVTNSGMLAKNEACRKYCHRLVAEVVLNRSLVDLTGLQWVERGKELESSAVQFYELTQGVRTRQVGFITTDDGRYGASPDRLISDVGGLEIKCPAPQTHVGYLVEGFGKDYYAQVQGQLLVGELEWDDRYSFHPEMPPVIERVYRDEPFLATMRAALDQFCDLKDEMVEKARAAGWFVERETPGTPEDLSLLHYAERFSHSMSNSG